ncbi:Epidermal patterning factor-like protein [Melia azedarach]|uniref:Epidermal patterning factor-like protein n=1 Tax=Melia azedarach TaxID=155640 RepID=A0ACC1XT87_MELAZ|nr:Epidermal patterning factor-like protein [Melia azedarach]
MTSLSSFLLLLIPILLTVFLLLFSPISSFYHPPYSPRGLLYEDKTRLGSIPPSCHNKCNQCHPCMAVQVPTLPLPGKQAPMAFLHNDPSPLNNKYSNYKPLGWKCRCNGHFYNP